MHAFENCIVVTKVSKIAMINGQKLEIFICACVCTWVQNELSDLEDLEEDEFESGFEDMKTDEEYEEELDPHSSKFRAEGQLMAYEEEPSFEGYLSVRVRKLIPTDNIAI